MPSVGSVLWVRYRVQGKLYYESSGSTSVKFAEDLYHKRRTEVAERKHFPTRQVDRVTFGELLDAWWKDHVVRKASKFEYLLPRLQKFRKMKARRITSELIQNFLVELIEKHDLSAV